MWVIRGFVFPAMQCLSLRVMKAIGLFPASCELHFAVNLIEFTCDIGGPEAMLPEI